MRTSFPPRSSVRRGLISFPLRSVLLSAALLLRGVPPGLFAAEPTQTLTNRTATAGTPTTSKLPFAAPLRWQSSGPLVKPVSDSSQQIVSVKDPTIVRYKDRWHVYATAYSTSAQVWNMVYLNFKDWPDAASAQLFYLDQNPNLEGTHCAPGLFYFRPQKKWYLIFQSLQPQYATADDPSKPETWTRPQDFFPDLPANKRLGLDYWVICDETHAYLFFTGDDGNMYRSRTRIEDFPSGMSPPQFAIQGKRADVFEGSMTYRLKDSGLYLTLVEAIGPGGVRYYRAWTAASLDGEWTPVPEAGTFQRPFAGINNVTFAEGVLPWTRDISHGELIRDGYDERMIVDPGNLQLFYQGRDPAFAGRYELRPYQLGLLKLDQVARKP